MKYRVNELQNTLKAISPAALEDDDTVCVSLVGITGVPTAALPRTEGGAHKAD